MNGQVLAQRHSPDGFGLQSGKAPCLKVGAVRYIKLGPGGKWAEKAITDGIIPFKFRFVTHEACARSDWDEVRRQLVAAGRNERAISQDLRELKEFYGLGEDTLWFTVADGHVWWTFAQEGVFEGERAEPDGREVDGPPRFRRTRTPWRNTSLAGDLLTVRSLSSALSSTTNYRRTICAARQSDYLVRRISGGAEPLRDKAGQLMSELTALAITMVRALDWRDFETLVDLVFAHGGYRRVTALGGIQADVDLVTRQCLTGEVAWIQVKSQASQAVFDDYVQRYRRDASASSFYFIYHSAARNIRVDGSMADVHVWPADTIATAAVEAGLFGWLTERVI